MINLYEQWAGMARWWVPAQAFIDTGEIQMLLQVLVASLFATAFGLWDAANATILTRCGGSSGTAYYFAGPLVPSEKSGWTRDSIAGGSLLLLADGPDYDVVYKDASGGSRSVRADSFQVIGLQSTPGFLLIVAISRTSATLEHWLFNLDSTGQGKVVWGSSRGSGLIQRSAIYEATCARP